MTDPTPGSGSAGAAGRGRLPANIRIGAVLAVAAAAAVIVWLIVKDDGGGSKCGTAARAAAPRDLRAFAESESIPVYWAGPRPGFTYELTETAKCNVYIRYLPCGVEIGDRRPDYTTIGTYPYKNAYSTLQALGTRTGTRVRRVAGGGIVVVSSQSPKSVYLGFPGQDYQVEVYDPSARRALRLATSGRVRPVP